MLQRVSAITAVSGESVLSGLYCSYPGDFEAFEARARELLREGFAKSALLRALTSLDGVKAVAYLSALVSGRSAAFIWSIGQRISGKWTPGERWPNSVPFLRKVSRTTVNGSMLKNLRQGRLQLIVIACELRAKSGVFATGSTAGDTVRPVRYHLVHHRLR